MRRVANRLCNFRLTSVHVKKIKTKPFFSKLQINRDIRHLNNFYSFIIIMKLKNRCKCYASGVNEKIPHRMKTV